jgi:hypothetical protein
MKRRWSLGRTDDPPSTALASMTLGEVSQKRLKGSFSRGRDMTMTLEEEEERTEKEEDTVPYWTDTPTSSPSIPFPSASDDDDDDYRDDTSTSPRWLFESPLHTQDTPR